MSVEDTVRGHVEGAVGAGLGFVEDIPVRRLHLSTTCLWGQRLPRVDPEDIVKRLKIGLDPLESYENFDGLLLSNGSDVMYEHHEAWHWPTGESAV